MINTYPRSSLVDIRAQITTPSGKNPTGDLVWIAFTPDATAPDVGDPAWQTATWEPVVPAVPPNPQQYVCRTLIGPSPGFPLTPGTYQVWVRIVDNPEAPVVPAGTIKVV